MTRCKVPWIVLLMAALTLVAPLAATAEDDPTSSELEQSQLLKKALAYTSCAVSIVSASTGVMIAVAVVTCGNALNEWFTE